jgi:hypothetical protein
VSFSFLGLGQESPALQLYGKLPVAKDYLRVGCGEGSGRELREWLDRAFGAVREASEQPVLREPLRFLGQGSKEPLLGLVWPSSDAGGLRSFPFTLFVARRKRALAADLDAGLAEAEGLWRLLAELRDRCLGFAEGREVLDDVRGREVELAACAPVESSAADFEAWIGALWPQQGLDGLFALFAAIGELARARHAGPYRLPLVRELSMRDQVLAWIALLRTLGALPQGEVPTLFFPPRSLAPPPELASLVVSRDPLSGEEIPWLTAAAGDAGLGAGDFTRSHDGSTATAPPSGGSGARLSDSLRDALAAFGARNR